MHALYLLCNSQIETEYITRSLYKDLNREAYTFYL